MSTIGIPDYKKPLHRRNNSGELDVFEAARYYNDNYVLVGGEKMMIKEERQGYMREGRRASLDIPTLKQSNQHYYNQYHQHAQKQQEVIKDKKKHKQPSSPGGKLAHFLNTLFNQASSRKKKQAKPTSTQSMKDEDHDIRRKRRSSISHFRDTSITIDTKSMYSLESSGFRTPPPYTITTPTKSCKDFRNFSEYKDVLATLSKYKVHGTGHAKAKPKDDKIKGADLGWVDDDNFEFNTGFVDKSKKCDKGHHEKKRGTKKFNEEVDDGAESDSSSDLFELQIDYEFGFCSSGLPVYETTHMDSIKRSSASAITNGPIKG